MAGLPIRRKGLDMATRRIDKNGDWTFGQGRANYTVRSEEIRQNVITRLKSFQNDWFLDVQAEIDWLSILGNKNNRSVILREVERVTLATVGVKSIEALDIIRVDQNRKATIQLSYTDIYERSFLETVGVTIP